MVKAQESKAKGFFFGILAAVSYGVNPLGAKYLYEGDCLKSKSTPSED